MKIITVVGARPQFVKAATVSREISKHKDIDEIIIHTGQHFDTNMSEVFFKELNIPKPDYNLGINGESHGKMTGLMLIAIEEILIKEQPEMVIVYGDTNTTLAGALASSKLQIPITHIESGLRSFNKSMPEETNRVLTDHISQYLFCPTTTAVKNLNREGIKSCVYHVGDVMFDSVLYAKKIISKHNDIFKNKFNFINDDFIFLTIHRQESTKTIEIFNRLINYILEFAKNNCLKIVFPVHPRIKKLVQDVSDSKVYFVEPLSYIETQYLLSRSSFVATDSGGLQKESYFHKVPCITLRSETEWVETIESGWNRLWTRDSYERKDDISEYGDGDSASKILKVIFENI